MQNKILKNIFLTTLFLLINANLLALKISQSEVFDEVISLGSVCEVATQMNANHLRKKSLPLDWVISPHQGLLNFILLKGNGFLQKENMKVLGVNPLHLPHQILFVLDTLYGIQSVHDFDSNLINYDTVKAKYERRIQRLFSLLEMNKKILFIRIGSTKEQIIELDQLLGKLYPRLNYKILAGGEDKSFKVDWRHDRIYNFHFLTFPGFETEWKSILKNFSLRNPSEGKGDKDD